MTDNTTASNDATETTNDADATTAVSDERGGSGSPRSRTRRGRRGGRGRRGESGGDTPSGEREDAPAGDGVEDATGKGAADTTAKPKDEDPKGRGGKSPSGKDQSGKDQSGRDGDSSGDRPADGDGGNGTGSTGSSDGDQSRDRGSTGDEDGGASSGRRRRRGRRGRGRGRGGSSDGGANDRTASPDVDRSSSSDDAVEQEIAKGGTRMAAKRGSGNRRGGGSGGGGGGGNRRNQRPGGVPEEVRRAILEGPPRTMLVTAREDRTRIAVLEDRSVVEHYVTRRDEVTYVGNIYMARVQNVLPGMEAAFLDIGKGRNGVLYAGEVLFDELDLEEGADPRIENVLKPGQKVLVQVTKDPMGTKGPRLTMHLSLAGRYLVLAPNSDLFGISRKLTDKERDRLRKTVKQVKPDEHGVIVRTAAEGATNEQLVADMERLLAKWARVEQAATDAKALTAVYEEPPLVVKVIRDNFGPEFERCIVDDEDLYHQVRGYLEQVAEELLPRVELYGAPTRDARARAAGAPAAPDPVDTSNRGPRDGNDAKKGATEGSTDDAATQADGATTDERPATDDGDEPSGEAQDSTGRFRDPHVEALAAGDVDLVAAAERREQLAPLFEAYDVADQLRKAMGRKVWLPSGGYLIIETTEAMKVIDVNTGKFTGGSDTNLEEVVLKTNLEAADEIVRQLRLRDMGGIIVIDFIDMLLKANQEQVVRRLKRELLRDRTKTRVSEVSKLGLVQMTRKNVSQGLLESFSHTCEHCEGRGVISELD